MRTCSTNPFHKRVIEGAKIFLLLTLGALLYVPSVAADYIAPEFTRVSTERYAPEKLAFFPGTYRYRIAWQGIPVAVSEIVIGEKPTLLKSNSALLPGSYTLRATARTAKVIDLLYKLRHTSESIFDPVQLRPLRFLAEQTENSRYKRWEIEFRDKTEISSKLWKKPTDIEPSEITKFLSHNFTVDPLFGALLARSIPVTIGSQASFDVWNGKNRYLIKFTVEGEEDYRFGKHSIRAYRVVPKVHKLTDSNGEKRLRSCTLWVSADDRREILRVESSVLVGKVSATLESFTPLEPPPGPELREAKAIHPEARAALEKEPQE